MKPYVSIVLLLAAPFISSAQFNAGETIRILDVQEDDLYVAGGEVTIDAPVYGDVMAAGGEIVVNDSIGEDLTIAGGEITVNGPVGDDLRIAGGQITVQGVVHDDVIVFGGDVLIASSAIIKGNVVSYTGKIAIEGTVEGAVRATGGEISISGAITGPSQLVAEEISIGDGAKFMSDVTYFTKEGEIDFGTSLNGATATLDESLGWNDRIEDEDERSIGAGIGLIGWIMFLVSGFIILALMNKFFSQRFKRASENAAGATVNSLGYGLIYLILIPLALIVLMITIFGIPAALLLLTLYIITVMLGSLIFGLLLSHHLNKRNGSTWGFWKTVLIGLGLAFALKLIALIPFLGGLASFVAVAVAYGAILLTMRNKPEPTVPAV